MDDPTPPADPITPFVTGRPVAVPAPRVGPAELDYPPVRNGVDYLRSVVDHLAQKADMGLNTKARDVKYAVLHLQAAAEVLLKARLLREHWSLVFKDPGTAAAKAFAEHSFASCTTQDAVDRLRRIAGIAISDKDAKALKDLSDDRNALQHFGLTHNARTIEARAAAVLDFLVHFLDTELLPQLSDDEAAAITGDMNRVRWGLNSIQSFVRERMNRLRGTVLKGQESVTVPCPHCEQGAVTLEPGTGYCHFCGNDWPAFSLAHCFQSDSDFRNPLNECPTCHARTLADEVTFADPAAAAALYCFTCAARFAPDALVSCGGCGCLHPRPETPEDTTRQLLCPSCRQQVLGEEQHG
ncbi:PHD finger domain-containing protein [Streptomyces melanogenes]|uniref:PHD finger domain-containing protein n=1 Tax=Streptomyces melanogenes TaxID=67326 RepID=UPI00167ED9E9|nr:PHD finger domain-containing protein [Streptomyces melanogenes]GGP78402.1 hypothetical protein GCM10010278_66020 [Streptomyces melanogenes]